MTITTALIVALYVALLLEAAHLGAALYDLAVIDAPRQAETEVTV